jgi:hypothetical protein
MLLINGAEELGRFVSPWDGKRVGRFCAMKVSGLVSCSSYTHARLISVMG